MNDPIYLRALLVLLFFVGSWLLLTKKGRSKLKAVKDRLGGGKFILLLAAVLLPTLAYGGYWIWTHQSTDPDLIGRQPDRPAPMDSPVEIDDYTITVTGRSAPATHREVTGSDTYRTLTIRATVSCDKDPGERCELQVRFKFVLPEGPDYFEMSYWLRGDEALDEGLPGGESVNLTLSPGRIISTKYRLSGAQLIFVGPGGRVNSRHQAYFDLGF